MESIGIFRIGLNLSKSSICINVVIKIIHLWIIHTSALQQAEVV